MPFNSSAISGATVKTTSDFFTAFLTAEFSALDKSITTKSADKAFSS